MLARLKTLLAGRADQLVRWLDEPGPGWPFLCAFIILFGGGLYGATLGLWRSPVQAVYTALKFPLLVLLTCGANSALNGMLAQVLGLELTVRQITQTILLSFALAALILCAFSPITLFLLWNTPALSERPSSAHSFLLAIHVVLIAFAGVLANLRLLRLLERLSANVATARTILVCWLAGNLFLGSQLAWVLRPFVGTPGLPVQFLRDHPLRGNFSSRSFMPSCTSHARSIHPSNHHRAPCLIPFHRSPLALHRPSTSPRLPNASPSFP